MFFQEAAQVAVGGRVSLCVNDVGDKTLVLTIFVVDDDRRIFQQPCPHQRLLNLTRFYLVASDFYLGVPPSDKLDAPIRQPSSDISRSINSPVTVVREGGARQFRFLPVAQC